MKLYDTKVAPNARRVRIFLAEKGISVPLVPVDLGKLEHKQAPYASINPVQQVPALELDDGTVLTESIAICRYFEELNPDPPLFGTGPLGRATVEMWQRRLEFGLFATVGQAFRHLHPAMAAMEVPQIAAWGEANKPRATAFLQLLDRHLVNRDFVCDGFTVADITGLVAMDFMKLARIPVPEELGHVRRWHAALAARPSASA
jgi:glutathione S-transferase